MLRNEDTFKSWQGIGQSEGSFGRKEAAEQLQNILKKKNAIERYARTRNVNAHLYGSNVSAINLETLLTSEQSC